MIFNLKQNKKNRSLKKNDWNEKFYFRCGDCNYIFYATIGTRCPNCGSVDVRIITESKLLKYFRR